MSKISNILLAIDDDHDDQALAAEVLAITKDKRPRITILSVTKTLPGNYGERAELSNVEKQEQNLRSTRLESLSTALSKEGIEVTVEHAVGKCHLQIIQRTLTNEFDLVMKPARNEVGFKQYLLGNTDIHLMSLCQVPVWIFRPTKNKGLKKIAVAIDLLPGDAERNALADEVLAWGNYIATMVDAELHVLHVWNLYREQSIRSGSVTPHLIDKMVRETEQKHRQLLDDAVQQVDTGKVTIHKHLRKGEAELLITQMTEVLDIDLLIMGTVGRTGIPGFFIGNTADSVLRKVACSVLTVKPEQFSTPVKSS